ncbi:hypothetical protein POX_f07432 [Penicillium oxalicum]|uniref:hypothetical protein n=1 Tax=Penicillium oxalicum TaxID=69781 RepID=UPI0020B6737B|nr:hypothetical protein POX_f07432 [Penicillium oxalicum]KAI2787075.1 hypothetical protein POX_f07432 [Penicillium oxalicum]
MEDIPNEDFCLPCLERSDRLWRGGEPFRVQCDHTAACQPFPASLEGTRLEYLALITTIDWNFKYSAMNPDSYNAKTTEAIHNLNAEFTKAVGVHQRRYLDDQAGLESFCASHRASIDPQKPISEKGIPGALYAKATTKPRLQWGDHGWYIWQAAVKDFNRTMMKLIDEYDESDYVYGDETCLQAWIRKFPLPLKK